MTRLPFFDMSYALSAISCQRFIKSYYSTGWSEMPGCKAPEILKREAYLINTPHEG
jgi:hypothetical protein